MVFYNCEHNVRLHNRSKIMKKMLVAVALLTIAVVALGSVNTVLAAESYKGGPRNGDTEAMGFKGHNYQGELGKGTGEPVNQNLSMNMEIVMDGLLDDIIHENLAIELGISPEDMAARIADGESIYDIAISLGFDSVSFTEIMTQVRIDALAQAVDLSLLTQDQADWLASRGFGNPVFEDASDCKVN